MVLILEAALLLARYGGEDFFALRSESRSRQWLSPAEEGAGRVMEEIFGFRLRLRDGAVEFYRQEESVQDVIRPAEQPSGGGDGQEKTPTVR